MDILDLSYTFVKCLGSNYPYKYNKTHKGMKRVQNRQFLSQKNLAMTRLLSEIDTPEQEQLSSSPTPPPMNYPANPPQQPRDSLSNLLAKAQEAVRSNSLKSLKHPSQSKPRQHAALSSNPEADAFLTGVLLNEAEPKPQPQEPPSDLLDEEVMKLLKKKSLDDELEELRRQIKLTNGQLKSYQRQVKGTQKSVYSLAGKYNSYFNLNIPVKTSTVDFSGLSYFELKNFKNCLKKQP